jgi:proteasome lid subunit RPN8/RPN11
MLSPLAWLKWQFFCHAGPTEAAAFGLSAENDPLCLDDLLVVRQRVSVVTATFDDAAVADLFDELVDAGLPPARFARVWLHTHPGSSPEPSRTDEATFARAFGGCDWAVMAILGRTGRTYARLRFSAGPGGSFELPVVVDWSAWPEVATDPRQPLDDRVAEWQREYELLVEPLGNPAASPLVGRGAAFPGDRFDDPFFPGGVHEFR